MNRAYQLLMGSGLSDATKKAIRNARRKWIEYRDAALEALRACGSEEGGSIRRLANSSYAMGLTKDQASLLLLYEAPPAAEVAAE